LKSLPEGWLQASFTASKGASPGNSASLLIARYFTRWVFFKRDERGWILLMETFCKRLIRFCSNRWLALPHSVALGLNILALDWVGIAAMLLLFAVIIWREKVLRWVKD
jgi:hypothetical protein